MTLTPAAARDLAHRVLVPGFSGTSMPDWLARRIERGLAGVCWFGQNVADVDQATSLAASVHDVRPDVLVLCDEEGGDVTRLEHEHGSSWPGHGALGHLDDVTATRTIAHALGSQVRSAGIDVALSPVADVNSDPRNPVIGVRSFGPTTDLVSRHVAAYVAGLQSAGVAACAKHFPGHGATRMDSHLGLPVIDDPLHVVRKRDLGPFAAAVQVGVRCVMTAHVVFADVDDQPATLSRPLLDLLRRDLGFDGVVISDALDMRAISCGVGRGPGAVRGLAAGIDLLCIGNPVFPDRYDAELVLDEIVAAVADAIDDGSLPLARLEDAAGRVADLAAWVKEPPAVAQQTVIPLGTSAVAKIAARALTVRGIVRLDGDPLVVVPAGPDNIAAGPRSSVFVDEIMSREPAAEVVVVSTTDDVPASALKPGSRSAVVVVGSHRDDESDALVEAVRAALPDAVLLDAGPEGREYAANRVVRTYGGGRAMAVAAVDALMGEPTR